MRKNRKIFIFLLSLVLLLSACASTSKQFLQEADAISIMAYNFENLFDTQHDEGTEDHAYLPLELKQSHRHKNVCYNIQHDKYREECLAMDWSESALERKMKRLAEAILQVNDGKGPDILIVEEVENIKVLKQLNDQYLKAANYQTIVLIEGFDKRGIDIGLISRLSQYKPAELHKIPYRAQTSEEQKWMDRSRGIMQAHLVLPDKSRLAVFGVHFPSGANPTYWREQSIAFLNQLQQQLPEDVIAIAGGDFNINASEEGSYKLYQNQLGKKWLVSHLIGCQNCQGTSYYHFKRQWSFLDALLFDKKLDPRSGSSPWKVDPQSIGIPNNSVYQKSRFMTPARFESRSPLGVSDHWPIFAVIKPRGSNNLMVLEK